MKNSENKKTAALLLGHGSRVKEANENMSKVVRGIQEKDVFLTVQPAFLELSPPTIPQGIKACVDEGAEKILIAPYFLHSGMHVRRDLPNVIREEAAKYPNVKICYGGNIGFHPVLVDIMLDRLMEAAEFPDIRDQPDQSVETNPPEHSHGHTAGHHAGHDHATVGKTSISSASPPLSLKPGEIESESFKIIGEEMGEHGFNDYQLPIAKRVIHASGDFEYGKILYFHPHFFQAAKETISASNAILTDVSMVAAGVNRRLLEKFGMNIHCLISEEEVMEESGKTGRTRASLAMKKGATIPDLGGILVGNAPTALREVIRLKDEEVFKPRFVIAAPVGFVDAEESKEALIQSGIPGIVIRGRKGGSPIAAAIMNAVLMLFDQFGDRMVDGDHKGKA